MISLSFIQADIPANSIGNYLESKVTVGSGAPTGESVLIQPNKEFQKETDCKNSGCFLDKKCYPYGYIINKKYCVAEGVVYYPNGRPHFTRKDFFINQSEIGNECNNNFECLTNFCLNGICINQSGEVEKRIEEEMKKQKEELEKQFNEKIEKLSAPATPAETKEEEKVEENIVEKIFNWFRGILG